MWCDVIDMIWYDMIYDMTWYDIFKCWFNEFLSCRRLWPCGSRFSASWVTFQNPNTTRPSATAARRSPSWPRSTRRSARRPTRESCRLCREKERCAWPWQNQTHLDRCIRHMIIFMIHKSPPVRLLQNSHTESHKKSSVRHKLVSLTLKKKSKITEEVSDAVTMTISSRTLPYSLVSGRSLLVFELCDLFKTLISQVWVTVSVSEQHNPADLHFLVCNTLKNNYSFFLLTSIESFHCI